MSRRATAFLVAAFAVAMVAVGLVVAVVDDGGGGASPAPGAACITDPPLVLVDVDDGDGGSALTVIQPDGSQSVVPSPRDLVLDAEFTPDRTGLVATVAVGSYESAGPETTTIWAMGLNGSAPRQLTPGAALDAQPVVSPDGATVAFRRLDGQGLSSIQTVPVSGEGTGVVVVAPAPFPGVSGPEWSPTGERLAYLRTTRDDAGADLPVEVRTVAPDGSDDRLVATIPGAVTLDWSPDGSQLLVSAGPIGPGVATVTSVDVAGGTTRLIAEGATRARWSRGGTQVVLVVDSGEGRRVVERTVAGVDGADVSGGADRDLGVTLPGLYPDQDIAVAACLP